MPHLPVLSGKKLIKILEQIGYRHIRQRGSHIRLWHTAKKPQTIPNHKTIGRGLLRKIIRDAEISLDEFLDLLK